MTDPRFPQDLAQAADVRCSVDALLLAAFVQGTHARAVDLGAGCGVVGLGLLLRGVAAHVEAIERDEEQALAVGRNAVTYGMAERLTVMRADIACPPAHGTAHASDLAVCNPPWRLRAAQRPPTSARRAMALYGTPETLPQFVRAAALRLRRGGLFAAVIGAERLPDLLAAACAQQMAPTRLVLVHPRPEKPATFALLEARNQVQTRLRIEPPLVLHGRTTRFSPAAQRFCPWLGA